MALQTLSYKELIDTAHRVAGYAVDLASPDLDVRSRALEGLQESVSKLQMMARSAPDCTVGCHMENGFCVPD